MTVDCKTIHSGRLAVEAQQILGSSRIKALSVGNTENEPVRALNMRDLLRAGVV